MRAECINAVKIAAQRIGKTLTAGDLQNIEGKIAQARKQLAKQDINAYRSMTAEEQLAKAGDRVAQDVLSEAVKKRQRVELSILKTAEIESVIDNMMATGMSRGKAIDQFTFAIQDGQGRIDSLEQYIKGVSHGYLRKIPTFYNLMEESSFGGVVTSTKNMMDYLKESYGIDSQNPLAKKAWREVEKVRMEQIAHFNRLGGDVAPLANYRNPQQASAYNVLRRGGKDGADYVNDYMNYVDRGEYVNPDGTLMTDAQMRDFLLESWRTVATDGQSKMPGERGGAGMVANRNKAHRQIHYKSPEAYVAAMEKYGSGNVFDQTRASFEAMAADIALVEKFGPNPALAFDRLYSKAKYDDPTYDTWGITRKAFDVISGQQRTVNPALAHWMGTVRSAMVASRLGSMLISQLADTATAHSVTRSLNIPTSELMKWVGEMSTSGEAREIARLHGLGLENALSTIARFADDATVDGFIGKAATMIPTIQGANLWTKTWRQGFGVMLEAKLGDLSARHTWASLLPEDRGMLERLGVTDKDFAIWKLATPTEYKGSKLLGADSIDAIPTAEIATALGISNKQADAARQDAAMRLVGFVVEQSHQAVLQPGARSQATLGGGDRGTVAGELARLVLQFKSFPMAMMRQQFIERATFDPSTSPLWFRGRLLAVSTIMGGMALVLNDIVSGKDPRQIWDSNDKAVAGKFAYQAIMKGGGLGFAGDIVDMFKNTSENPYAAAGILGPAAGFAIGSVAPMVYHGISALATQDEKEVEKFTKHAYDSIKGITPGQNLWFIKGFLHNVLLADLQEMANPGYQDRAAKRAQENYGNQYWLGMGNDTRTPEFGNMWQP